MTVKLYERLSNYYLSMLPLHVHGSGEALKQQKDKKDICVILWFDIRNLQCYN